VNRVFSVLDRRGERDRDKSHIFWEVKYRPSTRSKPSNTTLPPTLQPADNRQPLGTGNRFRIQTKETIDRNTAIGRAQSRRSTCVRAQRDPAAQEPEPDEMFMSKLLFPTD
jgi:hypothetical protein